MNAKEIARCKPVHGLAMVAALSGAAIVAAGGPIGWLEDTNAICVLDGACVASNTVCRGPADAGKQCRYCTDVKAQYACEFEFLDTCWYWTENAPPFDCGEREVGNCNGAGTLCINGVNTGDRCNRRNCFSE
jgi:hypothetical protein